MDKKQKQHRQKLPTPEELDEVAARATSPDTADRDAEEGRAAPLEAVSPAAPPDEADDANRKVSPNAP